MLQSRKAFDAGDMSASFPDPTEAAAPAWGPDDEWLECMQVRDETPDVRTFMLRALPARSFRYRPGQFITLRLDIDGEAVNRCYTLSSSPTRPETVSITVKRVPGGRVSNWLHEHLQAGQRLSATGPSGSFCFPAGPVAAPARGQLYLSGGQRHHAADVDVARVGRPGPGRRRAVHPRGRAPRPT